MSRPHHASIARALGPFRQVLERALTRCPASRILFACSGGADSVAMVGLGQLVHASLGFDIVVGHVDHGLREESAAEAEQVQTLAGSCGLECLVTRLDLEQGPGLPARARHARRQALLEQAARVSAPFVALGHTATDQAETMLMHLSRGAGLDGIAAMAPVDPPWCRPLLGLTRRETRALAVRFGLPFVDDPTNDDRDHIRVRVRSEVLPVLAHINPHVEQAMRVASELVRDADDALNIWARQELSRLRVDGDRWATRPLAALPRAIRMRVLREICAIAGADLQQLSANVVGDMDRAVQAQAGAGRAGDPGVRPKSWDLRPKVRVIIDRHHVFATATAAANH